MDYGINPKLLFSWSRVLWQTVLFLLYWAFRYIYQMLFTYVSISLELWWIFGRYHSFWWSLKKILNFFSSSFLVYILWCENYVIFYFTLCFINVKGLNSVTSFFLIFVSWIRIPTGILFSFSVLHLKIMWQCDVKLVSKDELSREIGEAFFVFT